MVVELEKWHCYCCKGVPKGEKEGKSALAAALTYRRVQFLFKN